MDKSFPWRMRKKLICETKPTINLGKKEITMSVGNMCGEMLEKKNCINATNK